MYYDLKKISWLDGMKKDIAEYVEKCPNFEQVRRSGYTQMIEVPTWK